MRHPIFLIAVALCLLASCGPNRGNKETRKVFCYNESAGVTTLDPAFARDQATIWACNQLYNGLLQTTEDLSVAPCIARSFDIAEDGLTYTFHLRRDVFFHDDPLFANGKGRRVTAADFVYSFNRIVDEKLASPGAWIFNNVARDAKGQWAFYASNDSTFVITLRQKFPPFPGLLTMTYCSVVPHEIVAHYGRDFRQHPVGTGPFKFKMWKEGVKLVYVKNPAYFEFDNGERLPYLDAVAITFLVDKQSAFLEFIKGKIDFLSGIDASYKDELLTKKGTLNPKYNGRIKLITQPYLNTEYLGFLMDEKNPVMQNSPLRDKRIRQAINYGFDREKMMKYLRNNIGYPAVNGFIPKGMPGFDSTMTGYSYQPDKARQLLADAGYPNGKGLPEITMTTTSSYLDLCEYIQHQLNEIGFTIKIDVNPPATLREVIAKSNVAFFRGSWIADYPDAENYLSLFYSPNFCPQGPNYTHYANKAFDDLYNKARNEVNDSLRYELYRAMDKMLMDEAPVVVLYYDQVLRFVQNNIEGLGSNPLNLLTLKKVKKL